MVQLALRRTQRVRISILVAVVFGLLDGRGLPNAEAQDPARRFIVEAPPKSPAEQKRTFHLPPGFQIELVASEPEVIKPINLSFDSAGQLLVTQSVEYPYPAPSNRPGRDTIKLIVDSDQDGVPDKVSTFATDLSIPIGVTPIPNGVLGYSVPNIYRFRDTSGDGQADEREVMFGEFGFADTHGMISSLNWWIDGWVYGCHGFVNTSSPSGTDGQAITMISGNTYRLRPDGSSIEHYSFGQVNPFGMSFDPYGNIFTADCHSRPATMVLRGAHYPRSEDPLGPGPELMQHGHGSTGIAGVVFYAAEQFPEPFRNSLFIANPITGRVHHDRLDRYGSTYKAVEMPEFILCDDFWFRPVDLQLGPDGALYIADFYNCIIGHYEVPLNHPQRDRLHGRIWRVRYVGEDTESEQTDRSFDLTRADTAQLMDKLGDGNLAVRTFATHELVERVGHPAVSAVRSLFQGSSTAAQRAHGLWVLFRLGALKPADWKPLLNDSDPLVRVHAVRVLAEFPDLSDSIRVLVLSRLQDDDGFVQRAAAEALGRHPHQANVNDLLSAWHRADAADVQLIHMIRMALRDTIQSLGIFEELEQRYRNAPQQLNQLADIGIGIALPQAARFLMQRLKDGGLAPRRTGRALQHIIRYIDEGLLPEAFGLVERFPSEDGSVQIGILRSVHRGALERGIEVPGEIEERASTRVTQLLESGDAKSVGSGIDVAREMGLKSVGGALLRLASEKSAFPALRPRALLALLAVDRSRAASVLTEAVSNRQAPLAIRRWAAEQLATLNMPESQALVIEHLPTVAENIAVSFARGLAASRAGAELLLAQIEKGTVTARVLQDIKVNALILATDVPDIKQHVEKLVADLPPQDAEVSKLITERKAAYLRTKPDAKLGAELFVKNCAPCHRISNEGQKVGPELDGVGIRGLDRILEDILDPNRNIGQNYRASVIVLLDGRVLTGLAVRQEGEAVSLVDSDGTEHRIAVSDIDEQNRLNVSPMPTNVTEKLDKVELSHLIRYLLDQQSPVEAQATEQPTTNTERDTGS